MIKPLEFIAESVIGERSPIVIFDDDTVRNVLHSRNQKGDAEHLNADDLEKIAFALANNREAYRHSKVASIGNATVYSAQSIYAPNGTITHIYTQPKKVYAIVPRDQSTGESGKLIGVIDWNESSDVNHARISDLLRNRGYSQRQVDEIYRQFERNMDEVPVRKKSGDWRRRAAIAAGTIVAAALANGYLTQQRETDKDYVQHMIEASQTKETNIHKAETPK